MKLTTLVTVGVALLAPATAALAADDPTTVEKPIRVLLGGFSATNGTNKQRLSFGVGYDFMKTKATNPTVYGIFVDHNTKKSGGLTNSMTGVGVIGRFYLESANAAGKPYATLGLGSFSARSQANVGEGEIVSSTKSKLGGKVGLGYELNNGWLGEIDYTLIQKISGKDPGGINFRLGYRF